MTVWMVASMKNPNNFRLDGNSLPASDGSVQSTAQTSAHLAETGLDLLSFRGSVHGRRFHRLLRGSRGYRTTFPSPSLRVGGFSTEGSAIHHPWPTSMEEIREISRAHSRVTKN